MFTDIADLVDLFKKLHIAEARGQFRHAINCLMRELKRMKSAEVRLVCRRNKFYIQCHNAAHREGYPGRYDTWQYWRSKKNAKPKRATYSIAPVLHTALNRSLLQFPT